MWSVDSPRILLISLSAKYFQVVRRNSRSLSAYTSKMSETLEQLPPQPLSNKAQEVEPNVVELLAKISDYEQICTNNATKLGQFESSLKQKDVELANYKKRVAQLEEDATEVQKLKAQRLKDAEEVEILKMKSEDTLTKAKSIIFDKTKVIKNQELQIEALNQQVSSLKDVVTITKDLLEIRNLETKQLEIKIKCMEDRVSAEKERQELIHKKLENMIRYNGDLKREYEAQLCLFSALRERYNERELAKDVVTDLTRAAEPVANGTTDSTAGAENATQSQETENGTQSQETENATQSQETENATQSQETEDQGDSAQNNVPPSDGETNEEKQH